jgi:hypothetical protein
MIIKTLSDGKYVESGKIRFKNGKVRLMGMSPDMKRLMKHVYLGTEAFRPIDGIDYLEAIVDKFSSSTGVALIKEAEDTWFEEKKG